MKLGYFDCSSGVAGNMILGSLFAAGVNRKEWQAQIDRLKLPVRVLAQKVKRQGMSATRVEVKFPSRGERRGLSDIERIIRRARFAPVVTEHSIAVFQRLARAEAKVHGARIDTVHFHEVGGYDCIVDIVGAVVGLRLLEVEQVHASAINLGSGTVTFSHGTFPVPAPATAELLKGAPVYQPEAITGELATPTGAAILAELVTEFGPLPSMKLLAFGSGAGDRPVAQAGALRFFLGTTGRDAEHGQVVVLETNIDDMNPELFEHVMAELFTAGALDVYFTPIQMKKNRPATLLSVIAPPALRDALTRIVLTETTSLGLRYRTMERICLARETRTVTTRYGKVKVKLGLLDGKAVTVAPEYEDCRACAHSRRIPLKTVYAEALRCL